MTNDKRSNFVRIAETRTNRIMEDLVKLGDLSKYTYYEYTPDQVNMIFSAIEEEMKRQKARLLERGKKFTLR